MTVYKPIGFMLQRKNKFNANHMRESFSTHRHLEAFINKDVNAYSVFISPQTFIDTKRYFNFIKNDGFEIRTSEISAFVNALENYKAL